MKKNLAIMPIEALKTDYFFVRTGINEDYMLTLSELYSAGVDLPPIIVTKIGDEFVVVDGRHRIEASKFVDFADIKVEIVKFANRAEMIIAAFKANIGGPLPPGKSDIEHTVETMLVEGIGRKRIIELMVPPMTVRMIRNCLDDVQSKIAKRKLAAAAAAVREGSTTVPKAAEQFGVDPEKLKQELGGRKGSKGRKKTDPLAAKQTALTSRYRGVGISNASLFREIISQYNDGVITEKQAHKVISHARSLNKRASRVVDDWEARIEAVIINNKNV